MSTITLHKFGSGDKLLLNVLNVNAVHVHDDGVTIVHCNDDIFRVQESFDLVNNNLTRVLNGVIEDRLLHFEKAYHREICELIARSKSDYYGPSKALEEYNKYLKDHMYKELYRVSTSQALEQMRRKYDYKQFRDLDKYIDKLFIPEKTKKDKGDDGDET